MGLKCNYCNRLVHRSDTDKVKIKIDIDYRNMTQHIMKVFCNMDCYNKSKLN